MNPSLSLSPISKTSFYQYTDRRNFLSKTAALIASLFRQMEFSLTVLYHRLYSSFSHFCGQKIIWKTDSSGLFVLIHGLNGDPATWHAQIKLLKKESVDTFVPVVPKRGACSLEFAARPILPTLIDFANNHPKKPICLIGASNGSRIATWLEIQMRKEMPSTPIFVSTIAGVFKGTKRIDWLEKWGLLKVFYPNPEICELKADSQKAKELLEQVTSDLPSNCAKRAFEFYGTTEDLIVPDLSSSLPKINKNERYIVVHGQSHDSVVPYVAKVQIASLLRWQKKIKGCK